MSKTIETGKDYGFVFGLSLDGNSPRGKGQMISMGGDEWKAVSEKGERIATSSKTTAAVMAAINTAGTRMGA